MTNQADVRSLNRIEEFHHQAEAFRSGLLKELEGLMLELRRLTNWIEQDVIGYWSDQSVQAERHWAGCRDSLARCQSYVRADEQRPCTEEKKRLRRAEQRLELCQQKLRLSQSALSFWQTELSKQSSHIMRCQELAESKLRVACIHLRGQIDLLQRYTQLRTSPSVASSATAPRTTSGTPSTEITPQAAVDSSPAGAAGVEPTPEMPSKSVSSEQHP